MKEEDKARLEIRLHLLKGSQMENEKIWKDFVYIYGHDHPRVQKLAAENGKIVDEINSIKKELGK